ncbi:MULTISPECIES: hypothetical protein [Bacillus amyloliquefaciens group]|uniref:hypothetical protein n=1 Tax=Bacillus amyloliquefaciens group TaxID=1938374 RepID=UPI00073CC97D|nr:MULTISPECIES: hypothetical protein [Bacillus amyloliquefaciens group]KTF59061.1 hypothetical protein AR691_17415 [Bacillus amyloliquefaciens]
MTLDQVAEEIIFGETDNREKFERYISGYWIYRKNKEFEDIQDAVIRGLSKGKGIRRKEIDLVSEQLNRVLKQGVK